VILAVFVAVLLLAACGGEASNQNASQNTSQNASQTKEATTSGQTKPAYPAITITGTDYAFSEPSTVQAGLVDITFVNNGKEPHQDNIARLNDGVSFDQFKSTLLGKNSDAALGLVKFYGGVNTLAPGQRQRAVLDFPAGNYVSICFVPAKDNKPHFAHGMLAQFEVKGNAPANQAQPKAEASVTLQDYSFKFSPNDTLPAKPVTVEVTNNGPQIHEIAIGKLDKGVSYDKVVKMLQSPNQQPSEPPPFTQAGGLGALQAGTHGWMNLNLTPGEYVALCYVPDMKTGKPHFMMGMYNHFFVK
jgi:hypothetical protein